VLTFEYKAATPEGSTISGVLDGTSPRDVAEQLQSLGRIPIRIQEARAVSARKPLRLRRRAGIGDQLIADFTRDLATLLRAGITLDQALSILGSLAENETFRDLLDDLRADVKGGTTLADALDARNETFGPLYVSMVRAGESGGALEQVLDRLAAHLANSKQLRDAMVSALIYPAILVVVAVTSVLILLGYVVPQFAEMFASSGQALPLATRFTIAAGETIRSYGWLLAAITAIIVLVIRRQLANPARLRNWHGLLLRLPVAGPLIVKAEVARFSRTLATLLQNGVTLLKALAIVKDTITNKVIAGDVEKVATGLKEGQDLATPLAKHTRFPTFAIHMIRIGEQSGNLQDILLQVAETFDRDAQTTIKRALALLEPVLILVLGGIIAAVIISILVAILGVNELVI